ncbi:hypothetical protein LCGC14_1797170 [marine sediment metagenome]|uniref:Uncharacterized protein n=1 Tax=marine sediment metagenome TaxID=412755 RepID=A0A0F9JQ84_9ZZZZ
MSKIEEANNILGKIRGKEFVENNPFESEEEADIFLEGLTCTLLSSDVYLERE